MADQLKPINPCLWRLEKIKESRLMATNMHPFVSEPGYKDFPKGDARRCFVVLAAIGRLKERATIHYISQDIGCTRAEAQRALEAAATQFGVVFGRDGSVYKIESWGVLSKKELATLIKSGK